MAVDTITLTDGNGAEYSLIVDKIGTDRVEVLKAAFGAEEVTPTLVSAANPMPVTDAGGATQTTLAAVLAKLSADPASQTTLAAVLAALGGTLKVEGVGGGVAQPISGTVTVANPSGLATTSTAPNRTSFTAADTLSHTLLALNTNRRGVIINNRSSAGVYVKYGTAAASSSYDVWVPSGGYWEMPQPIFTGQVTYAFASGGATGTFDVTEVLV